MVILNIKVDNIYMFSDFELDFTFPKQINNNILSNETLKHAPKIRYKKVNILMGGNATGKTTFGKLLCDLQNFLYGRKGDFFYKKYHKEKKSYIEVLFALEDHLFEYKIHFDDKTIKESIRSTHLRESYNLESHLEILNEIDFKSLEYEFNIEDRELPITTRVIYESADTKYGYLVNYIRKNLAYYYRFASFTEDSSPPYISQDSLELIEQYLKIIDPSIESVRAAVSKGLEDGNLAPEEDYYIIIKNGDRILVPNGKPRNIKDNRLSQGTIEAIDIAYIVNNMDKYPGIVYIDEQMAYMHTDLSNTLILKMITTIKGDTQLFVTTHDENVLDLNIPIHSFTFFVKKEGRIRAVNPEKIFNKSDRKLKQYVQNDYFETYPEMSEFWNV